MVFALGEYNSRMRKLLLGLILTSSLAQAERFIPKSFYWDVSPLLFANLLDSEGKIPSYSNIGFVVADIEKWTIGPAFSYLKTTSIYASNTPANAGNDQVFHYNLGARAFYRFHDKGFYLSPSLYYRWARAQFLRESDGFVERKSSNAGVLAGFTVGYETLVTGPLAWRASLGFNYKWNATATLHSTTLNRTETPDQGVGLDGELSLIFRFY